jgi:formate dehydrogenase iron-sulfur subunit
MCYDQLLEGKPAACAKACPTQATVSGDRDQLIAEARERISQSPGQYYEKIYGLNEVGGTATLYLAAVPFEQIGMRSHLGQQALPGLTWNALSLVPGVVSVGSVLLGGVWWITHRRDEVAKAEGRS